MTEREFWAILKQIPGWYKTKDGEIRRKARVFGATRKICPICAVVNKVRRKNEYSIRAWSAGAKLGIDKDFISEVAHAADGKQGYKRRKLLELCK